MSKNVNVTVIRGKSFDYALNKSYDFIMAEVKKDETILREIEKARLKEERKALTK